MPALIEWQSLPAGEHRLSCPSCGRSPRDKTLGVTVEHDGAGVAHCFRCAYVEAHRPERPTFVRRATAPLRAIKPRQERLADDWLQFWDDECEQPIAGVPREYLQARECVIPPADGDLRSHPALKHRLTGHAGPALVALVTHAVTREPMTLHFTWVKADGTKAAVEPARMLLGGHRKAGGVIRLWPDEAVTLGLGVAEGIETALSLAHAFTPVWACVDAGNLAQLPVLDGVEALLIAADHDEAGISAAEACARRWAGHGREAGIVMPDERKTDLNDLARAA